MKSDWCGHVIGYICMCLERSSCLVGNARSGSATGYVVKSATTSPRSCGHLGRICLCVDTGFDEQAPSSNVMTGLVI